MPHIHAAFYSNSGCCPWCCACRARFNRSHPYVLDRDVLIRSSEPPELGQMDFQFLMRKVLIAENVTLTLESLVLRNVNKLGGFGLDFFMVSLSPGSCVQLQQPVAGCRMHDTTSSSGLLHSSWWGHPSFASKAAPISGPSGAHARFLCPT